MAPIDLELALRHRFLPSEEARRLADEGLVPAALGDHLRLLATIADRRSAAIPLPLQAVADDQRPSDELLAAFAWATTTRTLDDGREVVIGRHLVEIDDGEGPAAALVVAVAGLDPAAPASVALDGPGRPLGEAEATLGGDQQRWREWVLVHRGSSLDLAAWLDQPVQLELDGTRIELQAGGDFPPG